MTDSSPDEPGNGIAHQAPEVTYEIGADELPSEAVVRATTALTNTPVIELDPLYDVVDPVHLDGVFRESNSRTIHEEKSVTFRFNECLISVTRSTAFYAAG
ncbi:HalOD1 output domain-containing protein [Haladaptatus salinisoli]|uniref:HalOD1 output domain-containing protein n=1 Tax=Haladaptatus salinisoli TaxID=2884876 RepID=UPI001D09FC2E|nr:HalOD1 output domain-containing protein [Haladaptatus salinisoli]